MKENTIISLADANYFELLNELVDSINRFEQSKKLDKAISKGLVHKNYVARQKSRLSKLVNTLR